jgi:hypothetical protein
MNVCMHLRCLSVSHCFCTYVNSHFELLVLQLKIYFSRLNCHVDWLVEASVSKVAHFSVTLASTNQSTQQFNPKEHNQNCLHHENFKNHIFF